MVTTWWGGHGGMRLGVATVAAVAAGAAGDAPPAPSEFEEISAIAQRLVEDFASVEGVSILLASPSQVYYRRHFGEYNDQTVVPIASATKLLSAVTILSAAEDGVVDLGAPVSQTLSQFHGLKGDITLRQMFSHMSGLPGRASEGDDRFILSADVTLEQAVNYIACCISLQGEPGDGFRYGGMSMHVGGRMVEVASGTPWGDLFEQRVAAPLGMTSTDYEGLGERDNPRIAAGSRSSLDDYASVLEMLLRDGATDAGRLLKPESVRAMYADEIGQAPILDSPEPSFKYGLGVWRDIADVDGEPIRISSPGAFGFTPWLELDMGYYGVFMVESSRQLLREEVFEIQALARRGVARFRAAAAGDLTGDFNVDGVDVGRMLQAWGGGDPASPADLTGDGVVNGADLGVLLAGWGEHPDGRLPPGVTHPSEAATSQAGPLRRAIRSLVLDALSTRAQTRRDRERDR